MKSALTVLILCCFLNLYGQENKPPEVIEIETLDSIRASLIAEGAYKESLPVVEKLVAQTLAFYGKKDSLYTITLRHLAEVYSYLGDYKNGKRTLEKVLEIEIEERGGNNYSYIDALNDLAVLYMNIADYEAAAEYLKRALEGCEAILGRDSKEYASLLNNLAALYWKMGHYEESETYLRQTRQLRRRTLGKENYHYALSVNNLAVICVKLDKYEEAEKLMEESRSIHLKLYGDEHPEYAYSANNLAAFYSNTERFEEAIPLYLQALKIRKTHFGEEHIQYLATLGNLAVAYAKTARFAAAEALFLEARNTYKKVFGPTHPDYFETLNRLSKMYADMGNYSEALAFAKQALQFNDMDKEDYANFLEDIKKAVKQNQFRNYEEAIQSLSSIAAIYADRYKKEKSKDHLQNSHQVSKALIQYIARLKNEFGNDDGKLRVAAGATEEYGLAIQTAYYLAEKENDKMAIADAFVFAENNKSVLLANALKSEKALNFGGLPDSLAQQERALREKITVLEKQLLETEEAQDSLQRLKIRSKLLDCNAAKDTFMDFIEKNYPQYSQLKYDNTETGMTQIQEILNEEDALLEYFVYKKQSFLIIVTKKNAALLSLTASQNEMEEMVGDLRENLSKYKMIADHFEESWVNYTETAQQLYQILIAPAQPYLKGIEHLIIVPDGLLGHIPFEVLLVDKPKKTTPDYKGLNYLLRNYRISYTYSGTLLRENSNNTQKEGNGKLLGIAANYPKKQAQQGGNPVVSGDVRQQKLRKTLSDLPAAKEEVERLAKVWDGKFLYGADANEARFKSEAEKYSIIHLAMHGLLDKRKPILSSLVFSNNEDTLQDNFLEAYEITHLRLHADLVVLSACETGYGKFEQGEGILSLARSFMYAGVPSLVVSLWKVNDMSTAILMGLFYEELAKGKTKSEALQQAKLHYLDEASGMAAHPAFWSPFIQLGDDRAVRVARSGNWSWWLAGIGILFAIGAWGWSRRKREAA